MQTVLSNAEATEPRSRRCLHVAAVGLVYVVACRVMLAPIFNFGRIATASYVGDARAFIWVLAWDNHAVLDRVPSLFDANKLYPLPNALAYGEHLFGISLFTLPIYALTRNPVLAYNVVWLLSYLFTAAAVHYVAWRYTRDHLAALFAGLAYTFCFFQMHHGHGHLNLIWSFWIPLSFVALERWVAIPTWRRLVVVVSVVVLQSLASWYEAVMITVADGLFFAWIIAVHMSESRDVRRWRDPATRRWLSRLFRQGAIGAALAFAVVWPFARHYLILHTETTSFIAGQAADLTGWFMPPENTFAGQWLLAHHVKGPRWIWGELTVYLGWTTVALAVVGAVVSLRSREPALRRSRFFILLACAAAALALGPSSHEVLSGSWGWSPFGVLARLPGVSLFRVPARYSQLVALGLAFLGATACAAWHQRFGLRGRVATVVAILLVLAESYVVKFPSGQPQPFAVPKVYKYIARLPAGAVVSLPDYAQTPAWYEEANYQYFSTAHWHPIVNGDSREWPAGFRAMMERLKSFPDPGAASAMREARIAYVVVHGAEPWASDAVAPATTSPDFRLIARFQDDYLFEVTPAR